MSKYIQFQTEDDCTILIEVDEPLLETQPAKQDYGPREVESSLEKIKEKVEDTIIVSQETFDQALDVVKSNARSFIRKIKELEVDKPDEVQMSFGLKATGELGGTFVVAKAGIEASYTVTLTWKKEEKKEG